MRISRACTQASTLQDACPLEEVTAAPAPESNLQVTRPARHHHELALEAMDGRRTFGMKKDLSSTTVHSAKVARR